MNFVLQNTASQLHNFFPTAALALFEDSGWYSANYTKSRISPWGHGAGCDFARKPCLDLDASTGVTTVPDYGRGYFCTAATQKGCSPSHFFKMACSLYDQKPNPPPERFQYFSKASLGGLPTADYCPLYGTLYKGNANDLDCRDEGNQDIMNLDGEEYGSDSMCFETTSSSASGRCYKSACNLETFTVEVWLGDTWRTCDYDFQELEIEGGTGSAITCPRLSSVCPDMFCPVNCSGRGVCNFEHEIDGIVRPKCECFNETNTSRDCSSSLSLIGTSSGSIAPTMSPSSSGMPTQGSIAQSMSPSSSDMPTQGPISQSMSPSSSDMPTQGSIAPSMSPSASGMPTQGAIAPSISPSSSDMPTKGDASDTSDTIHTSATSRRAAMVGFGPFAQVGMIISVLFVLA